ncbi:aspartate kinase [Candidatus Geothermarchaeota archaeon]|nr:MAG: aspartate kinase [Candidatus Geothermarchaeota archaeon]
MKLVMKFGGTSVGNASRFAEVARIIRNFHDDGHQIVAVVSAMAGVTDLLLSMAKKAINDEEYVLRSLSLLKDKHIKACDVIANPKLRKEIKRYVNDLIAQLKVFLKGIAIIGEVTPRMKDYVLSFGERLSAKILWAKLIDLGIKSKYFTGWEAGIVTDDEFGSAKPLMDLTEERVKERLNPLLRKGVIPVVTGYIASTINGYITTLGRGGSDYTASILGAALEVDEIWIWTDVDGIMTADPKIVSNSKTIPILSYDEAAEIAYFGAKVLQPYMLKPAKDKKIPIRVKNTFNPKNSGSLIADVERMRKKGVVKAVCINNNVSILTVRDLDPRSFKKVLKLMEKLAEGSVESILVSQSFPEGSFSLIVPKTKIKRISEYIREIGDIKTEWENDVSLIAVVGAGMKGTPGVAAKVFQSVAERGINIRVIVQGPSELNISFVVKQKDGIEAVRAIHERFNLGETDGQN